MLQPNPMRAPHPISSPPSAAASSDLAGGQAVRANGFVGSGRRHRAEDHAEIGQARGIGEDRIRRARASDRAIARTRAPEKSTPSSAAIFAPHTVKPKVTLQGWCAGEEHADRQQADHDGADDDQRGAA